MASHLVEDFGFPLQEVRVLLDDQATGLEVRDSLGWLLSDYDEVGTNIRFFHISTHGTQVSVEPDGDELEADGLDEAFVVHDHEWAKPFRDNEIRRLLARVPENATVIVHADCCHSGDLLDFGPAQSNEPLEDEEPATPEERRVLRRRRRRDRAEIGSREHSGSAPAPEDLEDDGGAVPRRVENPDLASVPDEGKSKEFRIIGAESRHVLLSACEDVQESKEFLTENGFHGGLTWAVTKTLRERKKRSGGGLEGLTWGELIEEVGNHLRFSAQTPLLECRRELLDTPVLGQESLGGSGSIVEPGLERMPTMSDKTTPEQVMLFLMTVAADPKKYDSRKSRLKLMEKCQFHPALRKAMKSKDFESISQALSEFVKPIGDEGGGSSRPIGDEGGGK